MRLFSNEEHSEKKEQKKKQHFLFRVNLFFFCIFILFGLLIMRLANLQFVKGESLRAQENSSSVVTVPIKPIRGNIYDTNGYPIAYSSSYQSLYYRADQISIQNKDQVIALAKRLAYIFAAYGDPKAPKLTAEDVLNRMDVGYDIHKNKTKSPSYYSVPRLIKPELSNREVAYISAHRDELQDINITEDSVRQYNPDNIAVQLIGYLRRYNVVENQNLDYLQYYNSPAAKKKYLNNENVGFAGLEYKYQSQLRGKTGEEYYPVNALQQIIGPVKTKPPVKGDNLFLTIDKNVQLAAQKAIMDHLKELKSPTYGGYGHYLAYEGHNATDGYAVAMEVNTGKIVAMASMPDYNPNAWHGGITEKQLKQIQFKYINGAIASRYAHSPDFGKLPSSLVYLGSTQKPASALLGLSHGLITPTEKYDDQGVFYFGKNNSSHLTNYNRESSARNFGGPIDVQQALHYSANDFFAALVGERLYEKFPKKRMQIWDSFMKQFGLGVLTGSGLPNESTGIQDYNNPKAGSEQARLVYAAFGQQAKYTTLQLAQYAETLATGRRMQPQFVNKITDANGNVIQTFQPKVLNTVHLPQKYWDTVRGGMTSNVHGFKGFPLSELARKTGTSEENVAGKTVSNAVFIAYAPRKNPKLAVAVVVPDGGLGSYGAAPIARKIFDAYDHYIGLHGKPNPNAPVDLPNS